MRLLSKVSCVGMVCVALTACGAKSSAPGGSQAGAQSGSTMALQRKLAAIAGQANGAAPAAVDPETRLDGAKAGPGLRLTTMYTLVNPASTGVDATNFDSKLAPHIREGGCSNPELQPVIDQGAVVVLEYRGLQGNLIGTVTLTRENCAAVK